MKPEPPAVMEVIPIFSIDPPREAPGPEIDEPARPDPEGHESTGKDVVESEPARGLPVEKSTSLIDLAPPPLPRTIGLGGSPPPLPGHGDGVVRGFSTRGQGKGEALRRYGGGGATESAVGRGLRWLVEHQDADGGWSADGYQRHCRRSLPCPGKGLSEFDVGITALAALAFLGAGHAPDPRAPAGQESSFGSLSSNSASSGSPFAQHVGKALDYLLSHQNRSGAFGATGDNYLYNHGLATFAMAEAFAMTGFRRYRTSVENAVSFIASAQQPGGGWDYTSKQSGRNDLSITGWQIMALRAAAGADVPVPEGVLERARRFLDGAVTLDGQGIYANLGQEAGRRGINMVAVGLLSRIYVGASATEARVRTASKRLLQEPPDWEATGHWESTFQSYYHWYTASLALFHLGGEEWKAWDLLLRRCLLPLQSQKVHELGSWPPEASWVGMSGGRVYSTAVSVLTLETYYRYEPLLQGKKNS